MRVDGMFIGVEVEDDLVDDADLARRLEEACPVDIYASAAGRVRIVEGNLDECVLCRLCLVVPPPGAVRVLKLYDGATELAAPGEGSETV